MSDSNLQFIREKIYKVRSAIMYSQSNELIKLPNSVITAVKVDDEGQLWFVCNKPTHSLENYQTTFPARLNFYKKGIDYKLEVSGKAEIVNHQYRGSSDSDKPLLIKLDILNVEYTEMQSKNRTLPEQWFEKAYSWILRHISLQPAKTGMTQAHS